ncbi:hypothetical protein M9458_022269, partial [Cirrhinus mrigala]
SRPSEEWVSSRYASPSYESESFLRKLWCSKEPFGYMVALVLEVLQALIERGPMLSIEM